MKKPVAVIIEDERNILELLKFNLDLQGFEVYFALDGREGLEMVRAKMPEIIILDLMLPKLQGMDLCKILKQDPGTKHIPIIILTAKALDADVVLGLEMGADDYMTKPFSVRQLLARVKAVLRRGKQLREARVHKSGDIVLDESRHIVTAGNEKIHLTYKEFNLLKTFLKAKGQVVTRDQIIDSLWAYPESLEVEATAADKYVGKLRQKLGPQAKKIKTIKNYGYRFEEMDESFSAA